MNPAEIERIKELLPTTLGSDEIRAQVAADILRRSIFSARMASAPYLAKVREVCAAISAGEINQSEARARLLSVLEHMGHSPQDGGGLKNPASIRRLNLIVDTQRQMAANVSRLMGQTEATLYANPAWELMRLGHRDAPRADWIARWRAAGDSVGWEGAIKDRFIALKTSPIWQALGEGAGGFADTLGNPYPPFAYGSGMGWIAVSREECERMGLDVARPKTDEDRTATLSPDEQTLADAVKRYGFPEIAEGLS